MGTDINMDSDKKNKRKLTGTGLWRILFGTVLAAFTLYAVLDTFVIPRNMQTGADTLNLAMFGTAEPAATDTSATAATAGSSAAASATADKGLIVRHIFNDFSGGGVLYERSGRNFYFKILARRSVKLRSAAR